MGQTGISITKSVSFRGVQQEFSNVYYYDTPVGSASDTEADSLINQIVVIEKTCHSTDVSFVRAKAWSAGGSPASNNMILQKNLSGTGSLSLNVTTDRERAILIQWSAGIDSRGRPVKLRKWFHTCGVLLDGSAPGSPVLQNTAAIATANRTAMATKANALRHLTAGIRGFDLSGPTGRATDGDATCHQYLEHHQLGDMWR